MPAKPRRCDDVVWHMDEQLNHSGFNLCVCEPIWIEEQSHEKGRIIIPVGEMERHLMRYLRRIAAFQRLREQLLKSAGVDRAIE